MKGRYNPDIHHRKSIRLRDYDYAQAGAYFVTICTKNKECMLGDVVDGMMRLSELGKIVEDELKNIPIRFPEGEIDKFVIMPNHIHGIIIMHDVGATLAVARTDRAGASPAPTIGHIIGSYKSLCINKWLDHINKNSLDITGKFWQRNYYEHIIRNEEDMNSIREYILNNPLKWLDDENNPVNLKQARV